MKYNDEMLKEAFEKYNKHFYKSLPTNDQLDHITFSDKFEKRMKKLIRKQNKFYYPLINTVSKRVACLAITMLTVAAITTFSVKAFRKNSTEFIIKTFDEYTRLELKEKYIVDENTVLEPIDPTYIPEGFKISKRYSSYNYVIIYKNDNKDVIVYTQNLKYDFNRSINTEHSGYQEVPLPNGKVAIQYGFAEDGSYGLIWTDDKYVFEIGCDINQEEALKVIESVENQKD